MTSSPAEVLDAYVKAFESQNVDSVIAYYRLPCTFITPTGVTLVTEPDAARRVAAALIEHARSQQYRRTALIGCETQMLGAGLAWLRGVFVRFNADDVEISRFGFGYIMQADDTGWRIVVAIAHEVPLAPSGA